MPRNVQIFKILSFMERRSAPCGKVVESRGVRMYSSLGERAARTEVPARSCTNSVRLVNVSQFHLLPVKSHPHDSTLGESSREAQSATSNAKAED